MGAGGNGGEGKQRVEVLEALQPYKSIVGGGYAIYSLIIQEPHPPY